LIAELLKGPQLEKFHLGLLKFEHLTPRFRESMTMTTVFWVAMGDFVCLNGKILRHSGRESTLPWFQLHHRFRFDVRVNACSAENSPGGDEAKKIYFFPCRRLLTCRTDPTDKLHVLRKCLRHCVRSTTQQVTLARTGPPRTGNRTHITYVSPLTAGHKLGCGHVIHRWLIG
jgi:hypothetical protein